MATLPDLFAAALRHHQAGQPQHAEPLLHQILAAAPRHGGALHLLGIIASQSGRFGVAVDCLRQAAAIHPNQAVCHSAQGFGDRQKIAYQKKSTVQERSHPMGPLGMAIPNNAFSG